MVLVTQRVERKHRGAFFTPPAIAEFLADWAIARRPDAKVLDPTCGDGVFLRAAAQTLLTLSGNASDLERQVYGVDLHARSLQDAREGLAEEGLRAHLIHSDFFAIPPRDDLFAPLPRFDAVVGNPPFIRYQEHAGEARRLSLLAAFRQGVRISALTSAWAPLLVHAGAFLSPEGRLAMVLPAELLTVGYAEPIRRWLRERFASVHLILFERLQFPDALADVVLLLAQGSGGCDAFSLQHVRDAADLRGLREFSGSPVALGGSRKWTDLLLTASQRGLFHGIAQEHFAPLRTYGPPELGTVTGANAFFTLNERTRREFRLIEDRHVRPVSPPGTRHLKGTSFTHQHWEELRDQDAAVWILCPDSDDSSEALRQYTELGWRLGVNTAYKCRTRTPWWKPPVVTSPDLFFTYMSHRFPRLVANEAGVTFVNSMHGIRLNQVAPAVSREALPFLAMNSMTLLGAELFGRSYGGGVLKMEPREAAILPVPNPQYVEHAWRILRPDTAIIDRLLREGRWQEVVARVDDVLLARVIGLPKLDTDAIAGAAARLRSRRLGRSGSEGTRITKT